MNKSLSAIAALTALAAIGVTVASCRRPAPLASIEGQPPVDPRPITLETMCRHHADAYCARCEPGNGECSSGGYISCIATSAPESQAHLAAGESMSCANDIQTGDCRAMQAGIFPASCRYSERIAATAPTATVAPTATASASATEVPDAGVPPEPSATPGRRPWSERPDANPNEVLTVSKACDDLMQSYCNHCYADKMAECVKTSLLWCYNARAADAATTITRGQMRSCKRQYLSLKCEVTHGGYVPLECNGLR